MVYRVERPAFFNSIYVQPVKKRSSDISYLKSAPQKKGALLSKEYDAETSTRLRQHLQSKRLQEVLEYRIRHRGYSRGSPSQEYPGPSARSPPRHAGQRISCRG